MYTWDDIIDLEPLWKKTFDGDSIPKGRRPLTPTRRR